MGGGGKHFNDSSAQPANRAFPATLDTHGGRGGIKGERGKKGGGGTNLVIVLSLPTGPFQPLDTEGEGEEKGRGGRKGGGGKDGGRGKTF